jgi:hypothetical protein
MGRQPKSGDFSWLSAHSILNWIGGDVYILIPSPQMSRTTSPARSENLAHGAVMAPFGVLRSLSTLTLNLSNC